MVGSLSKPAARGHLMRAQTVSCWLQGLTPAAKANLLANECPKPSQPPSTPIASTTPDPTRRGPAPTWRIPERRGDCCASSPPSSGVTRIERSAPGPQRHEPRGQDPHDCGQDIRSSNDRQLRL